MLNYTSELLDKKCGINEESFKKEKTDFQSLTIGLKKNNFIERFRRQYCELPLSLP